VSTLYVLVYALGPGLFLPLEQEVSRAVATRHSSGLGNVPLVARAGLAGAAVLLPLLAAAVVLVDPLADSLFGGSGVLVLALGLALTGLLAAHLTRGLLAGTGHYGAYSAQLTTEGLLRLGACGVLAALGTETVEPYALVVGIAPLVAVAVTAGRVRAALAPGPTVAWSEISAALGLLLVASLGAQVLVNAGPVAVALLADPDEAEAAGRFLASFVVARVPLFVFAAVQATLLAGLARALTTGDRALFWDQLRRVLLVVGALAAAGVAASAAVGPAVVEIFFGADFRLDRRDLVLLSASTAAYLLAVVLHPALVALGRYGASAGSWLLGLVAFALACVPEAEVLLRVERALLIGTVVTLVSAALLLQRSLTPRGPRQSSPPDRKAPA
jgi:O-antigen/teichoic acid export membrane protein